MRARRTWLLHLRLLPGGDVDLWTALAVSAALAFCLGLVGLIGGLVLRESVGGQLGPLSVLSAGTGLPAAVLLGWTGLRVARSRPLGADEAGVDLRRKRVFFPEDAVRVPAQAVLVALRPRQVQVQLADGRWLRLVFRANGDPGDLLRLGSLLRRGEASLTVEEWVEAQAREFVRDTLPDPQAIGEALRERLLEQGVVVTRSEALPAS